MICFSKNRSVKTFSLTFAISFFIPFQNKNQNHFITLMCVIVTVSSMSVSRDTFHLVDLLSCSVMVLQPNSWFMLFMDRQPYFQVLNNQQGKLINLEEKLQPRNYYSIYLLYLNLKYFPYIAYIGDASSKTKKFAMLQTSVFM